MRMLWINLIQAVRSMRRHGRQTLLSLLGLAVGLSCFTFSYNWLWYETHYESFRPDYRNILSVAALTKDGRFSAWTKRDMADWLRDSVPGVTQVTALTWCENKAVTTADQRDVTSLFGSSLAVHDDFWGIVRPQFLYGNPQTVQSDPEGIVLTRTTAQRVFGRIDVMGESLTYVTATGITWALHVTGVVEDEPKHTELTYTALLSERLLYRQPDGGPWRYNTAPVLFRTTDTGVAERRLAAYKTGLREGETYMPIPFSRVHVLLSFWDEGRPLVRPVLFTVVSLLLLLSMVFNYIAVLTSCWMGRRREYLLRISLGATLGSNVLWLCSEVVIMVLAALLCGAVGVEFIDSFSQMPVQNVTLFATFGRVAVAFVAVMALATLYPLLYIRRMATAPRWGSLRRDGRLALLFIQMAVCALLLFVFACIYRQYAMMTDTNRGFRHERIVRLFTRDQPYTRDLIGSVLQALRQRGAADVEEAVVLSSSIFQSFDYGAMNVWPDGRPDMMFQPYHIELTPQAVDFFGIRAVEGAIYMQAERNGMRQVLINRAMADQLPYGYAAPGSILQSEHAVYQVCGVVDFQVWAMTDTRPCPYMYEYSDDLLGGERHEVLFLRYREGRREQATELLRRILLEHNVPEPYIELEELDEFIQFFYEADRRYLQLFTLITAAGMLIALFGVFSLISYMLAVRRRSLAIRRVFGASAALLCRSYLRTYLLITVLGCVASVPCAAYLMGLWLQNFSQTVTVNWLHYATITLLLMLLVAVVVLLRLYHTLRENPVEVIKEE